MKNLNSISYCLLFVIMASCISDIKKEERMYMKENVSLLNFNCDSIRTWFNREKNFLNQTAVYKQIGIKDSIVLKVAEKSKQIDIHANKKVYEINRTEISLMNQDRVWSVYYTQEFKILLFIEIKSEDPSSVVYLSNEPELKNVLCSLVADSSFILNQLKYTSTKKFTPPTE